MLDSGESELGSRLGSSTISLNSSDAVDRSVEDANDDNDDDEEDEEDDGESKLSMAAALAAAAWTSRGASETGRGRAAASWGKLRIAELPLMLSAATS